MTNIMAYLLAVSVCGAFRLRVKYDRICSWIMFIIIALLFVSDYRQTMINQLGGFSILWSKTQLGDIRLDFFPTSVTNQILLPIFLLSLWAVFNNSIFRFEEKRCAFNSSIILNFIVISLMFCATNYVQLITMVFFSDIIGYILLKNAYISKRYVIYNFFADICLFMILALACGKIQSIDMTRLLGYEEIGRHKDFVGLTTALALFIKIGIFPFHRYLTDISSARFQRMLVINLLGSPLTGMLLLLKLKNLVLVSNSFIPLCNGMAFIGFIVGIICFTFQKKIEIKTTYFNMVIKSLLLLILINQYFNWSTNLALYFMFMYLFNQLFFEIYMSHVRIGNVSCMHQMEVKNIKQLRMILIEETVGWSMWLILLWSISKELDNPTILYTSIFVILAICIFLSYIYQKRPQTLLFNSKQHIFIVPTCICLSILTVIGYMLEIEYLYFIIISCLVLGIIILPWYKILNKIYDRPEKQFKPKKLLADKFMQPLSYISRMFQLFLDVFLSEKIITAGVNFVSKQSLILFLKISKRQYVINIFSIILGYLIFIIAFVVGDK